MKIRKVCMMIAAASVALMMTVAAGASEKMDDYAEVGFYLPGIEEAAETEGFYLPYPFGAIDADHHVYEMDFYYAAMPYEDSYRILFEGIACWANLRFTYKTLQSRGINLTASVYGPAFSFLYSNLDELMAAYSYVPNSNCFERELELRVVDAKKNKVDGAIFHMNRSCKHWSGNLYEMERQFREQTGVPTIVFDGDQSDPRAFSEAQYETRVEALVEIMEENKRKEAQA